MTSMADAIQSSRAPAMDTISSPIVDYAQYEATDLPRLGETPAP